MNDTSIEAVWVMDSETSEELLINLKTNKIIARRNRDGNIKETAE